MFGYDTVSSLYEPLSEFPIYYYKIQKNDVENQLSAPFQAVVSPEEVSSVSVIMYHNFVSDEDIKSYIDNKNVERKIGF